ncbi:MAG TPA: PDZ domain-containing protein, partial [Phaeodactylibacter sp.]|nr:PDZ domain-containing protein [Phaeodactylibacter sp.]
KENLYLQAHWRYNKGFKYDRSGLELIVSGEKLETITVYNLIENSPAKNAGFQKGDLIKSVNYIPASVLKLSGVNQKLQKRVGKKIRIKIKRNGKTMILKFRLKDLI